MEFKKVTIPIPSPQTIMPLMYDLTRLEPADAPPREGRKYLKSQGYKVYDNPGYYETDKYTVYFNRGLKCWIRGTK